MVLYSCHCFMPKGRECELSATFSCQTTEIDYINTKCNAIIPALKCIGTLSALVLAVLCFWLALLWRLFMIRLYCTYCSTGLVMIKYRFLCSLPRTLVGLFLMHAPSSGGRSKHGNSLSICKPFPQIL